MTDVAEKVLEETITEKPKGDVVYFWSKMKLESKNDGGVEDIGFWSLCDILNGGNCRWYSNFLQYFFIYLAKVS